MIFLYLILFNYHLYLLIYSNYMIAYMKELNLPNSSPNPLRDKSVKLHY